MQNSKVSKWRDQHNQNVAEKLVLHILHIYYMNSVDWLAVFTLFFFKVKSIYTIFLISFYKNPSSGCTHVI